MKNHKLLLTLTVFTFVFILGAWVVGSPETAVNEPVVVDTQNINWAGANEFYASYYGDMSSTDSLWNAINENSSSSAWTTAEQYYANLNGNVTFSNEDQRDLVAYAPSDFYAFYYGGINEYGFADSGNQWVTADQYYANLNGNVTFSNEDQRDVVAYAPSDFYAFYYGGINEYGFADSGNQWVTADQYYANRYGNVTFSNEGKSEMLAYAPTDFYAFYYAGIEQYAPTNAAAEEIFLD